MTALSGLAIGPRKQHQCATKPLRALAARIVIEGSVAASAPWHCCDTPERAPPAHASYSIVYPRRCTRGRGDNKAVLWRVLAITPAARRGRQPAHRADAVRSHPCSLTVDTRHQTPLSHHAFLHRDASTGCLCAHTRSIAPVAFHNASAWPSNEFREREQLPRIAGCTLVLRQVPF